MKFAEIFFKLRGAINSSTMRFQTISDLIKPFNRRWVAWWKRQTPNRQDRVALLAPMAAVAVFLLAIISSVWLFTL
jgi:hypothetical protein